MRRWAMGERAWSCRMATPCCCPPDAGTDPIVKLTIRLGGALPVVALVVALAPAVAHATAAPIISGAVSDPTNLSATGSVAVSRNYAYQTAYHVGDVTAVALS